MVLASGADVRDLLPEDGRVQLIHVEEPITIGEKRNYGCERARGSVIVHWDDDDHSEPERIADQVARLVESGKAVTGYHSMRFTDGTRWWRYEGAPTYAIGTSLCYRAEWWRAHRFPYVQVGEDTEFVDQANHAGQLHAVDDSRELMWASVHDGNTSPRRLDSSYVPMPQYVKNPYPLPPVRI